jgi:hypothetical protein
MKGCGYMSTFKNLNDLYKHIEDQVHSSLLDEVAQGVRDVMSVEIQDAVYTKYPGGGNEPDVYRRRYDQGGLLDESNMEAFINVKTNTLEVFNNTPFNDGYNTANHGLGLTSLIENGHGADNQYYDYHKDNAEYMKPRPFVAQTKESVAKLKSHKSDLKRGLKARGIKVK